MSFEFFQVLWVLGVLQEVQHLLASLWFRDLFWAFMTSGDLVGAHGSSSGSGFGDLACGGGF